MTTNWNEKARLWADFNDIFRGNLLEIDLDFAMAGEDLGLAPGDWVRVYDGEGNECSGLIDRVDGSDLLVKLDLASWTNVSVEILSQPSSPTSLNPTLQGPPTRPVRVGE